VLQPPISAHGSGLPGLNAQSCPVTFGRCRRECRRGFDRRVCQQRSLDMSRTRCRHLIHVTTWLLFVLLLAACGQRSQWPNDLRSNPLERLGSGFSGAPRPRGATQAASATSSARGIQPSVLRCCHRLIGGVPARVEFAPLSRNYPLRRGRREIEPPGFVGGASTWPFWTESFGRSYRGPSTHLR